MSGTTGSPQEKKPIDEIENWNLDRSVTPYTMVRGNMQKAGGSWFYSTGDLKTDIALGNITNYSFVHKFGRNANVSTSLVPVCDSGGYQTPTSAVSLEFVSSSASDALNSTGMHELTIEGLDANWNLQTVTTAAHATNGTTAVAVSGTWLRVFRAYVSQSGAYANVVTPTPSHIGTITIRVASAGATYATIPTLDTNFGGGQSLIGWYTVPAGYTAYLLSEVYSSDVATNKTTNFYLMKRENANDTTSSYTGTLRVQQAIIGTDGTHSYEHQSLESFPQYTDFGFMALASAATDASVEFEILLVAN